MYMANVRNFEICVKSNTSFFFVILRLTTINVKHAHDKGILVNTSHNSEITFSQLEITSIESGNLIDFSTK